MFDLILAHCDPQSFRLRSGSRRVTQAASEFPVRENTARRANGDDPVRFER